MLIDTADILNCEFIEITVELKNGEKLYYKLESKDVKSIDYNIKAKEYRDSIWANKLLDIDEFDKKYEPIENHFADDEAIMHFETYGEELEFVKEQNENNIWTIVEEEDDDNLYLISGFSSETTIGYIVTKVPFKEKTKVLYLDRDEL